MVGGIFAAIGLWPLVIRGQDPRWWALLVGLSLLLPAVLFPAALVWPYKGWMWIGHILGWINTRIILGVIFYLIVTPTGFIRRVLGRDPMGRKLRPDLDSYRVNRQARSALHLKKQF